MGYMRDEMDDAFGPKWGKRLGVLAVIFVVYLCVAAATSIWPFSVAKDLAHNVVNAEKIVSDYQWYYDQYGAIKAQIANIHTIGKDAPEYKGMIMVVNNAIAEYNSRSKQITRNLWKAQDLPYQIDFYEESK